MIDFDFLCELELSSRFMACVTVIKENQIGIGIVSEHKTVVEGRGLSAQFSSSRLKILAWLCPQILFMSVHKYQVSLEGE